MVSARARRVSATPPRGAHLVVPSPTSSSCVLLMSTSTLAAGLSRVMARIMVAPSLVTVTLLPSTWAAVGSGARGRVGVTDRPPGVGGPRAGCAGRTDRLQDLVHALGAQRGLHQVRNGERADKGGHTRIVALQGTKPWGRGAWACAWAAAAAGRRPTLSTWACGFKSEVCGPPAPPAARERRAQARGAGAGGGAHLCHPASLCSSNGQAGPN